MKLPLTVGVRFAKRSVRIIFVGSSVPSPSTSREVILEAHQRRARSLLWNLVNVTRKLASFWWTAPLYEELGNPYFYSRLIEEHHRHRIIQIDCNWQCTPVSKSYLPVEIASARIPSCVWIEGIAEGRTFISFGVSIMELTEHSYDGLRRVQ